MNKKLMPLFLVVLSLIVFLAMIIKNEVHLQHSESIYVRLKPVDPRSLIQGDYMVLSYQLYFSDVGQQLNKDDVVIFKNKSKVLAYVELDAQGKVIRTSFDSKRLENDPVMLHRLMLNNPSNQVDSLYPASNSFLFAEGLAECYQAAQYAEFKVNQQGKAILASLRGEDLEDLACEANVRVV